MSSAVRRLPDPAFAILDGAWFADLPALLAVSGLPHRCLFRDECDAETRQAGPWLVDSAGPESAGDVDRVLALAGHRPALVFWSCPAGEEALYRHLRSLNEVLFPRRPRGETGFSDAGEPERIEPAGQTHERLLFRHWDPRVLASVVPLLDADQSARLLGPGQGCALDAGYGRGVSTIMRPSVLPDAPAGPLRFTPEQIAWLDEEYRERFRWGTVAYLREHCGQELAGMEDRKVFEGVVRAEEQARRFGLHRGPDLRKWAWLCLRTDVVQRGPEVRAYLGNPANGPTPTDRFDRMWRLVVDHLDGVEEVR